MTFHIYHLIDPLDGLVRYVGRCTDPKARLRNHCNESQRRQTTKKSQWIHALMGNNMLPAMVVVATYTDPKSAQRAETAEILRHKTTIYNVHDPLKFPAIIAKKGKNDHPRRQEHRTNRHRRPDRLRAQRPHARA